ncbi:MAG: peptidoglycan DD-metalloendopeptidase family protein [Acidobacteriota bacterium]
MKKCLRWVLLPALVLGALVLDYRTGILQESLRELAPLCAPTPFQPALARTLPPPSEALELERSEIPIPFELERGQTLGAVLEAFGLESRAARDLTQSVAEHLDLRKLRAGAVYDVYFDDGGSVAGLSLTEGDRGRVKIRRQGAEWASAFHPFVERRTLSVVNGRLDSSLEGSLRAAGAPVTLAYRMADVLQWDLDFTRDLRLGDEFRVIFEKVSVDGVDRGAGRVLALEYRNRGRLLEAYSFPTEVQAAAVTAESTAEAVEQGRGSVDGYYDAEGRPLRKMFLRSPLRFSRVTSRFSHRRFHPVLKTYRPHYGVDYGAPTGTPVRVTANGSVSFAGWNRGGGWVVKVRHPNQFETAYLHLSSFASGISRGRAVRQGEVIGYVGSTGLSTGPHLDYRVKHRGRYIDPLSMKSVPAEPVRSEDLDQFLQWRDQLRQSLGQGEVSTLASWFEVEAAEDGALAKKAQQVEGGSPKSALPDAAPSRAPRPSNLLRAR